MENKKIIGFVIILIIVIGAIVAGLLIKPKEQLIGGCAGVHMDYWQECCDNWTKENDIMHVQCVGEWTVEDSQCEWECETQNECEPGGRSADEYSFGKYIGPKKCCEGLVKIPDLIEEDGECFRIPDSGTICSDCENGNCEDWENKCNCPEDCE